MTEVRHAGGLAYREAGPPDGPSVLLVHGWPYSAYLDRGLFDAGLRQISFSMTDAARDEYWKGMADEPRRAGVLDLFRSADPDELVPHVDDSPAETAGAIADFLSVALR